MENVREFNMDEVSLRSIAADVLKNFWVIILAVAAAWLAVGGAQKLMYVPEYTATATLAVNTTGSTGSSYSSLTLTNQMAEVFGEVFSSNVLKENIAKDLGVDQVNGGDIHIHYPGDQFDCFVGDFDGSSSGLFLLSVRRWIIMIPYPNI